MESYECRLLIYATLFFIVLITNIKYGKFYSNISTTIYPHWNLENIRKSILNFTAHFGEINPDMPYLCRRSLSGPERAVFASFPSVRREAMKKIVKSSIFCEKTSKFLRFLSFKP